MGKRKNKMSVQYHFCFAVGVLLANTYFCIELCLIRELSCGISSEDPSTYF